MLRSVAEVSVLTGLSKVSIYNKIKWIKVDSKNKRCSYEINCGSTVRQNCESGKKVVLL